MLITSANESEPMRQPDSNYEQCLKARFLAFAFFHCQNLSTQPSPANGRAQLERFRLNYRGCSIASPITM